MIVLTTYDTTHHYVETNLNPTRIDLAKEHVVFCNSCPSYMIPCGSCQELINKLQEIFGNQVINVAIDRHNTYFWKPDQEHTDVWYQKHEDS